MDIYLKSVEDVEPYYMEETKDGNIPVVLDTDGDYFHVASIEKEDFKDYIDVLESAKLELYQLNYRELEEIDFLEHEVKMSTESINTALEIAEALQEQSKDGWIKQSDNAFNVMINSGDDGLTLLFDRLELEELQEKSYQVHQTLHESTDYTFDDEYRPFTTLDLEELTSESERTDDIPLDSNELILTGAEIEATLLEDFYVFSEDAYSEVSIAGYMYPVDLVELKMNQKYVVDSEISDEPILLSDYLEDKNVPVPGATFEDYVNSALKKIPEADGMVVHTLYYEDFEEYFSEEVIDGFDKTYERLDRFDIDMDKPFIVIELSDSINPEANVVNIDEIKSPEDMLEVINETLKNETKNYRIESFNRKDVIKERDDRLEKETQKNYRLDDELEL